MKVHTTEFKEQIKTLGRELDSIISFNGAELGVEELNSVTPYYEGNLLKSVMKQLDIDSNIEIPIGTEINYKFGVKVGDNYEYLDLGNYIVNEVEKQENTNSYIIKCYDKMLYSMVDYEKMNISYPISIRNYINAICEYLRLNFKNKNEEFVNYNKNIPNELYFDEDDKSLGYTFRDVLDELAEVTASTICVNNDELEIRYINDTKDTIDEEFLKNVNVNFGEKYGPINSIVLSRSAGSDNVYLQDENSINENGLTEIKITDNQIMNFNDRSEYLTDILDKLNGIEFYLNDFTSTGIVYYELCDSYNVQIGDNVYNCIMLNDEIKVTQGLVEEIFTERLNTSETDYSKSDKTDRKINQTNLIVDKQRGIIQGIVEKTDNNSSRITELEIADGEFSVQVSNIEKGIIETNQNVSTLQASLDNVSADFEDFKDNEFINSIGNLQDQIDGAIQFWNGEEIPTINNYPANEWETEEERNNHRADIYTVIEDVDGELKQGKAYRFDKVDNIWQWIELTDNELSAVQAIAQEALDKSNKNIGDIQELVKKTSELSVKDEEITASVEEINNKYEQDITLTKEANGNPVVITDAGPYPLESIKIEGKSYQETKTSRNKFYIDKSKLYTSTYNITLEKDGGISFNGTLGRNWFSLFKGYIVHTLPAGTYTFSITEPSDMEVVFRYRTQTSMGQSSTGNIDLAIPIGETSITFTVTEEILEYYALLQGGTKGNEINDIVYIQLEEGDKQTGFVPCGGIPSPDFPSEIKNVEGVTNLLPIENKEYSFTYSGSYKMNAINLPHTFILKAGTYSMSFDIKSSNSKIFNKVYIMGVNEKVVNQTSIYKKYSTEYTRVVYSFTTTEDYEISRLDLQCVDPDTFYFKEFMLLKGTYILASLPNYVPFGRWLEVKSSNKNKLYLENLSGTKNGITYTWEGTKLTLNGTATANTDIYNFGSWTNTIQDKKRFLKAGTYTLSVTGDSHKSKFNTNVFYNGEEVISMSNVLDYSTRTLEKDMYYGNFYITIFKGKTFNNETFYLQLEAGSTVTEYEPYKENTALIDLNIYDEEGNITGYRELCAIGDTKDTFKDGILTQRIGKVVLDGSEGWFLDTAKEKTQVFGMGQKLPMSGYQITSSHFVYNASGDAEKIASNGSDIYIAINKTTASTTEEFKNWLKAQYEAGTPIEIEYILATPIEHNMHYQILELHEGYNNITTNDDLEPNMEITYLTDSKLNAKYATKGELKVTADNITSEINSTLKNGYTTIEQTNKIEQKITDTENEILIEVDKKVTKENYNTDKENLQKDIDSKVAEEDFTGANILLAINGDESEAQINADKINLNGVVTANGNFIIRKDGSMEAKAGTFGAWNIDNDGNIYADRKVGNKIYRTYIQQANAEDGGETWAFSTQVSENDGQTFYYTSFITNDGELYAEKDIISTGGTVAGQHLTALDLTYNPEFIIPISGETIQSGTVSLPTSQSTAVAALTIDPGKYLVVSQFQFSTNADGQRAVNVSTSSGATSIDITQRASSGLQTRIRHVGYLTPTKQTTYYWNMYQTSGATLSGSVWIQLFRLQ